MKKTIAFGIAFMFPFLLLFSLVLAAENPPSLTDFQQFYGQIGGLAENFTYSLKANVDTRTYTIGIIDGKYGYSPTFKVYAVEPATITFYARDELGIETVLGTAEYSNKAVTRLDFQFPGTEPEQAGDDPGDGGAGGEGTDDSGSGTSSGGSTTSRTERQVDPSSCSYNWECGMWSVCTGGRESRTCLRIDDCDSYNPEKTEIVQLAKPMESRVCFSAAGSAVGPAKVCQSGSKRCKGVNLEKCATGGSSWDILKVCDNGCDSGTKNCKTEAIEDEEDGSSSLVFLIIGGIIVLGGIIGLIFYLKKKTNPVTQ